MRFPKRVHRGPKYIIKQNAYSNKIHSSLSNITFIYTYWIFIFLVFVSKFRFSVLPRLPSASSMSVFPILSFPCCSSLLCWVKRWTYADGISYREGLHWWFPGELSSGSEIGDAKATHGNFMKPFRALPCGQEGLPRWLGGKESTCNAGDTGDVGLLSESGRSPGGGHGNPLQCFCLERRLAGYSPGGHKEHAWSGENDMLSLSAQRQGEASSCFLHRHLHHPTLAVISSFTTGIISHSSTTQHHHFFFKLLVIVWSQSLLFYA